MPSDSKLSGTDAKLLAILQRDGRRAFADLGADVGISGPSAHERVKKLEARGIIRGYVAAVDPAKLGLDTIAFMWVTQAPGTIANDLSGDFAAIPQIEACHRIAGEGDYLLKIRAADVADLERTVRRVQGVPDVYRTETDLVFSTAFERRPLPVRLEGPAAAGDEPDGPGAAGRGTVPAPPPGPVSGGARGAPRSGPAAPRPSRSDSLPRA
jgi:Lrp/AsnC family leucine-responsive transcriptional regulator